jgi:endoglucanase
VGATSGPVAYYGELQASGSKIIGSKTGAKAQVRGLSFYWNCPGWENPNFWTKTTVDAMVDSWNVEILRAAMGYSEGEWCGGYQDDPATSENMVKTVVDAAIAKGIYIIIDWHSHHAHNTTEAAAAKAFFAEMAQTYGHYDNVIFEIYNEPKNDEGGTWNVVKSYANTIIAEIRKYSNNLILVGTPQWDQQVNAPVLGGHVTDSDNNYAYVFHFYSASHSVSDFGSNITQTLNNGKPVFVTEYGITEADGSGSYDTDEADNWHDFMDDYGISSCMWSIMSDDAINSSSIFKESAVSGAFSTSTNTGWTNRSNMTTAGTYIYGKLADYAATAPWRSGSGSAGGTSSASSGSSSGGGSGLFCDFGPVDYNGDGGCFEVEFASDCDTEYGKLARSCGSTRFYYCDWGPIEEDRYGEITGGCYRTNDPDQCEYDYGIVYSAYSDDPYPCPEY